MTTAYDPNETDGYNDSAPANNTDLPAGTYRARAVQWGWDEDKNGDPCVALLFELSEGKPGYRLDGRLYLDESKPDAKGRTALSRSMEALRAMGLDGQIPGDLSTVDLSAGEVSLVVEINAKGYPFAHFINAPRAPRELRTFATPAPQKVNAFLAKINARLKATEAASRASGTASMQTQPARQPVQQPAQGARTAPTQARAAQSPNGPQRGAQAPQRGNQPPPKVHGQTAGEFGGDDDIPF